MDIILNAKRIFMNFFTGLINNFIPYFAYCDEFDENNISANEIFAFKDYLKMFSNEDIPFMSEFVNKTMVNYYYLFNK
jgi:hypothetical protein